MSRRTAQFVLAALAALLVVVGLVITNPITSQTASADGPCKYTREGAFDFGQSGYPGPAPEVEFEVVDGDIAVVEFYYAPLQYGTREYFFVPVKSSESGNGKFTMLNAWHDYGHYYMTTFRGCSYKDVMWRMAYIAAMRLDSIPTKWALNYDRIGLIEPEVPGDPLPQPPSDPLVACSPREWNRVPLGSWISGDADHPWEVEFRGDSAFGTYPGTTLVGPANLRYFWGDCDPGRWWEPFAFERLLAQEKDPFGPTIGVEWDPFRFVRDGRLFLPYVWGNAEPIEGYP